MLFLSALKSVEPYSPLAFLLSASMFLRGNPLVRLSAPVLLLILPGELPNRRHHKPKAPSRLLPMHPKMKPVCPDSLKRT